MAATGRSVPRFLPTLTEIVHAPPRAIVVEEPPAPVIDRQAILERVRNEVDMALQMHLEATVANAMLDQTAVIVARLREEIQPIVRRAVADAIDAELNCSPPG